MRLLARVLCLVGAVALVLGLVAGVANRQLLDTDHFVAHADAVRQDSEVSRRLAIELSDRVIAAQPDLAVGRPLLEATLQAVVRSAAFAPAFRAMAAPLHQAAVGREPDTILLRLADVGAVLTVAAREASPQLARAIPADLDVQLARIGASSLDGVAIDHVDDVRLLSWLLPVIAVLCFAGAVAISRGRRLRMLRGVGWRVLAVGVALAAAGLLATYLIDRLAPDTLGGAVLVAGWRSLDSAVRTAAVLTAAAGYLVAVGSLVAEHGMPAPGSLPATAAGWLRGGRELSPAGRGVRAVGVVAAGVLLVLEPLTALTLVAIAAGVLLIVSGLAACLIATADAIRSRAADPGARLRPRLVPVAAGVLAVCLVAALVVWNARASTRDAAVAASSACNGAVVLCDRRFNEVAFPATHNSMSAADEPGWFLADQPDGIIDQLDAGIRVLLIDTWYAQPTARKGFVANTDATHDEAFAQARQEWGPEVVDSALRLRHALHLAPHGRRDIYLCHSLCLLGATRLEPILEQVRGWLAAHPREVVTFIVQDEGVSPASTAEAVKDAGLLPDVYTPTPADAAAHTWPTLGSMIDSGHRLVFLAEHESGGRALPWLLPAFDWVQDTPYKPERIADFSCRRNRGPADAGLFLVNHWLDTPLSRVSSAVRANSAEVLGQRLDECEKERGMLPNFVAVDYYDRGDLFGQIDRLNGLRGG